MTLSPRAALGIAAAVLLSISSCGRPGAPPQGQPALVTFDRAGSFEALVDRFNHAAPGQIQVLGLFSPT
jgi:hypothetical protein